MVMPLIITIFLSAILAVAGISKLTSLDHVLSALAQFKLPDFLRNRAVAIAISGVEIVLATVLLISRAQVLSYALIATALVFTAYFIAVFRVIRDSDGAQCGCFGKLSTMPIGPLMLIRNGIYVATAIFGVILVGNTDTSAVLTFLTLSTSQWFALLGAVLVIAGAVLTLAPALTGASEPETTDDELGDYLEVPIPYGELETEDGESVALRDLPRQKPQLLIFSLPDCISCLVVLSEIEEWIERFTGVVEIKVVFLKPADIAFQHYPNFKNQGIVLFDTKHQVFRLLRMRKVPSAVLFGTNGLISGGPATGDEAVKEFIDDVTAELEEAGLL
ncbi:MAG: MauE/DoxX family redox-associated membrane protein [Actinomycetaceae bacterium]|nr:MauE/DoxX family redox-associated membrane protein [Actinomycetaceae bacterium]